MLLERQTYIRDGQLVEFESIEDADRVFNMLAGDTHRVIEYGRLRFASRSTPQRGIKPFADSWMPAIRLELVGQA
ncbi:hypothetical protein AB0M43_38890 [Longispora sp. NPDC051575]|uniref:hypothetical protein n=1 Tax=Longispora sp. NPDC051575 TaxID=3154943 RepID=UPI0034278982